MSMIWSSRDRNRSCSPVSRRSRGRIEPSLPKVPDYPPDMPEYLQDNEPLPDFRAASWDELMSTFPNQPIYSFKDERIIHRVGNSFCESSASKIYSSP